jgi:hypothetical protein
MVMTKRKPMHHYHQYFEPSSQSQIRKLVPRSKTNRRCALSALFFFVVAFLYTISLDFRTNFDGLIIRRAVCPLLAHETMSDHLMCVHKARFPSLAAGQWIDTSSPSGKMYPLLSSLGETTSRYTEAHLECLAVEHQGNCYDPSVLAHKEGKINLRLNGMRAGTLQNSPGVLNASDHWVWVSEDPAYKTIDYNDKDLIRDVVQNRNIYLIGDSLTRQWSHQMRCEFAHTLGLNEDAVHFFNGGFGDGAPSQLDMWLMLENATARDYLIFNFGHHVDPAKPGMEHTWRTRYVNTMEGFLSLSFAPIPSNHVFFRTTSVRHFLAHQGDWDTNSSRFGALRPNMVAGWGDYGGNNPVQPLQNLIGISMVGNQSNYGILDTSPLVLSRADATYDGSHFCLPGPHEYWSRMLYYRILQHVQYEEKHGKQP